MSKEKTPFWVVVEDREELQDHTAETELEWPAFGFRKILIQVLKVCRFPAAAVSTLGKQPVIEGLQGPVRHAPAEIEEGVRKSCAKGWATRSPSSVGPLKSVFHGCKLPKPGLALVLGSKVRDVFFMRTDRVPVFNLL